MPVYEYEPCDGECRICRGRFVLHRPVDAPALAKCPLCRKPVRKLPSQFNTPRVTRKPSVADAKGAGFTVLKKTAEGEYERQ